MYLALGTLEEGAFLKSGREGAKPATAPFDPVQKASPLEEGSSVQTKARVVFKMQNCTSLEFIWCSHLYF